ICFNHSNLWQFFKRECRVRKSKFYSFTYVLYLEKYPKNGILVLQIFSEILVVTIYLKDSIKIAMLKVNINQK
ncbi:MAG: hypothetical protein QM535_11195, partial [Limnohabitans sp.]|nr:hypothetical protein [Limnohabitans sp.]